MQWSRAWWLSLYSQAENGTEDKSHWNYEEWDSYIETEQDFGCNMQSIIEVESVIIMNMHQALSLLPDNRSKICGYYKESIKVAKSIVAECQKEPEENFESFSKASFIQYILSLRIDEFKTTQQLICSPYQDSSESTVPEGTCDKIKIRDNLLAFIRLDMSVTNADSCSDGSLTIDAIELAQQSCSWEIRSALSLIISEMRNSWLTMCTAPTCNIQYVDLTVSLNLKFLEDIAHNTDPHPQAVTDGICKRLKSVLAIAMNHTIDCPSNVYSSISRKIDVVKESYVKWCGALPQEPKPCVLDKLDTHDITFGLGKSFFLSKSTVCLAAKQFHLTSDSVDSYCADNAPQTQKVLSCLSNTTASKPNTCGITSWPIIGQLHDAYSCFKASGIDDITIEKVDSFLLRLQKYVPSASIKPACPAQDTLVQLLWNATASIILSGETKSSFCGTVQDAIDQWFTNCGGDKLDKNNIVAFFSLVCPKTLQLPGGCSYNVCSSCFETAGLTSDAGQFSVLDQCVKAALATCAGPIADEALAALKYLAAAADTLSPPINDSTSCICDPASAVNCIMEVHHMSKQITPDWNGLCQKLPDSETCARSYIQGCEECKKSNVLNIVHKLNSQLEETCRNPPVTECTAVSALKCVTDLALFQASSGEFSNDTICIQITIARQCVYDKTEKCDAETVLSITKNLEHTISFWKYLVCQPPEDLLKNCTDVFETSVNAILLVDMNAMLISRQKNETTLWNKFTTLCGELDYAWSCMSATLNQKQNETDAKIVKQTLEALYNSVNKWCKPPQEPLQCFACDGDGKDSCAKGHTIQTCNDNEVCETTTLLNQNVTTVTHRGCTPRATCKPGCDKNGCTYSCSDKLCNSLEDGPVEGTCDLVAVTDCVMDLSEGYIEENNFQCSSFDVFVECLKKEKLQCDIGGTTAEIEPLIKLNLTAEVHLCLLEEAKQTCEITLLATTISYVTQGSSSQFESSRLCGIVAESRNQVAQAEIQCTKDEVSVIKEAQVALEATIGHLDCQQENNITIDIECKPVDALLCKKNVLGDYDVKTGLTCQAITDIVACIKPLLVNCTSPAQVFLVKNQIDLLKPFLPANTNCVNETLVDSLNPAMTEVTACLHVFSATLHGNPIAALLNASLDLQSCLLNIKKEVILSLEVTYKLSLEIILTYLETIIEIQLKGELNLNVTVSPQCSPGLNAVLYKHATALFGLPFLPIDQRAGVCNGLDDDDDDLETMVTNCDMNETADIFGLLDILRERFLIGYCDEIKPIPRCLTDYAEECYERFVSSFGFVSEAKMCSEAKRFVECAVDYTHTCTYPYLQIFHKKAAVAVDFVSQVCIDNPELVTDARCDLLGREDTQPGCISTAASDCAKMPSDNCSDTEAKSSCFTKNAGSCVTNIPPDVLKDGLHEISQCRYGDDSHSEDKSMITQSCSSISYTCDVNKAIECLKNLRNEVDIEDSFSQARQCLEENYYCFRSVMTLISEDFIDLYSLVAYTLRFTPSWNMLESAGLKQQLILSSYMNGILNQNVYVTMSTWDICFTLNTYADSIVDIGKNYPYETLPSVLESEHSIRSAITEYCNVDAQELEQPPGGKENPACPEVTIKALVDILISRVIFEVHTPNNSGESVCSLYLRVNQTLEADVGAELNLHSCSNSFNVKVRFVLKMVQILLGKKCEVSDYDIRRCDVDKVKQCVDTLYQNFMLLGINQTIPGLCKIWDETEVCVEKYSYKCESCTLNYIDWYYKSVKNSVKEKCSSMIPPEPVCEHESKPNLDKCDLAAATKCAVDEFKNVVSLFMKKDDKCRKQYQNLNCIHEATGGCTATLPKFVHQSVENVNKSLADSGCSEEKPSDNSGCQDGCWVNKCSVCIEEFKHKITERLWPDDQLTICGYISDVSMCVAQNTRSCSDSISKSVIQTLGAVLLKFPGREDACINEVQTSTDFDDLVRQIENLEPDDDDKKHNTNLQGLCLKVKKSWGSLQKVLQGLPEKKKSVLSPLYDGIYATVQKTCSDTRELECFYCENTNASKDCEVNTVACPRNKGACMFKQTYVGSTVKYSAGCTSGRTCYADKELERTYVCDSDLCNKKANFGKTCELEPVDCKLESALKCAVDFATGYMGSENINCTAAIFNMDCILTSALKCRNSGNLFQTASKIFFNLASTTCVVNAGANDCVSLAITSMQAVFKSAYTNEGNAVCVALQKATDSVNDLIAGGTCSEYAIVSHRQILHFFSVIVGNYCNDNKCIKGTSPGVSESATQLCSGFIFDGILHIYKGYIELAKTDGDCGIIADNALLARQKLRNCHIGNFVYRQLDDLDLNIKAKCQLPTQTDLPEVCPGTCQAAVVLNYTDEVSVAITAHSSLSRWYLNQVLEVYAVYTSDCTSIQQKDVAGYINSVIGVYIEADRKNHTDFVFQLDYKKDIYYDAVMCSDIFQTEITSAFCDNNQTKACQAIEKLRACDFNLPILLEDLLTGSSKEILGYFEEQNICGDLGNDRDKRDTTVCQFLQLSKLIGELILPLNIETSVLETRATYCQNLYLKATEAEKLVTECANELSTFQKNLYKVAKFIIEVRKARHCPPLHYEDDTCDFKQMQKCWEEYDTVSSYAAFDLDTLCRKAKFTLECSQRFSTDCPTDEENAAFAIRKTSKIVLQDSLGNGCPLLTSYFYCNASVTVVTPACRWDEAEEYRDNTIIDFTKLEDTQYCQSLTDNVTYVQKAASGCEAGQIAKLGWKSNAVNGMCGISDISLDNVCRSVPVCSVEPIGACFTKAKPTSCQSLDAAFVCMNTYLVNNSQCRQYPGTFLLQHYFSVYYQTLINSCKIQFNVTVPQPYGLAGVEKLVLAINVALGYNKTSATATEIVNYIYTKLSAALNETAIDYSPISSLISTVLFRLNINISITQIEYNTQTDTIYTDTDKCFFTRARACLGLNILKIFTLNLLTWDDRYAFCSDWKMNSLGVCLNDALSGCPSEDRDKFLQISSLISNDIVTLGVCEQPVVCLISEANECINKFATILADYDSDNDTKALCVGRLQSKECLDGNLLKCSADEAKPVKEDFKKLYDKVEDICKDVELPKPPICPAIKDRDNVCNFGYAFRCLANFNFKIILTSDSLIWRQQCLDIQKMMVCIAMNTTSCDPENADVKIIIESLEDLKTAAGIQCPWLSEDLCQIAPDCPVDTSSCDIDLERNLNNKVKSVCESKQEADQCIEKYTSTCTQAQKLQAKTVINKTMASTGFPKELSCQAGSIDACLYSYLAIVRESYWNNSNTVNCDLLTSQHSCILSSYSSAGHSSYLDLAMDVIDKLTTILTTTKCTAQTSNTCTTPVPVKKLVDLITQLVLNDQFSAISFCAKSQAILLEKKQDDCNAALYDAIFHSAVYKQSCANEIISCDVAAANVQRCIQKIGVFSTSSCADKQKAAICVTTYLPANCSFNPSWLNGPLCNDTVVLQISGDQWTKNFISESGLSLKIGFKFVAGNSQFKLKMTSQAVNDSSVPSYPWIYTGLNPQKLQNGSNEIKAIISARQDYRRTGPKTVNVQYVVIPYQLTTNATSGQQVETELTDKQFTVSTFSVSIEDSDQEHSICTSLNDIHVKTFDGISFNNNGLQSYILYRHLKSAEAVVTQSWQCSLYGTCNCGVTVFAEQSHVKLSMCDKDTDFITYSSTTGSDTLVKQPLFVFIEKNLQIYHVVILKTGTIVTVEKTDKYMQVYIQVSPLDFGNIQGLCGNFDGVGLNDFEMPNGTVYKLNETDTQFGVITPVPFNNAWKISNTDAADWSKIYRAGVVPSTADMSTYCYDWNNGTAEISACSLTVHLSIPGFVSGQDQTSVMLAIWNQGISTASKRRKKRQAVAKDESVNNTLGENPDWSANGVWNQSEATKFCMDNLFDKPLLACKNAIVSLNDPTLQSAFDEAVKMCADDMRLSGDPSWIQASRRAASQACLLLIEKNPQLASDLAAAFINMRCDPFDCSGHGTCSGGVCICDSGYVGTKCDVSMSDLSKQPYLIFDQDGGAYLCELNKFGSDCSSVFISGGNFVSSSYLSCHIREVEITETGIRNLTTGKVTVVKAELITTNQVRCNLGSQPYIKRSLEVSVSNDGKMANEQYQTFIAYDPTCYDCDFYSCKRKSNVCIIGNRCVAEGESSVYSDCQYCNPASPNTWSIRLEIPGCKDLIPKDAGEDTDKQTLTTALIAVGCSLGVIIIILITVCCMMKRRHTRRRGRAAQIDGSDNPGFHDMPFTGKPIPAYKARQWSDNNLSPPTYSQNA